MDRRFFLVGVVMLSVILVVAVGAAVLMNFTPHLHGSVINPPIPAADFTLTDQVGKTAHLTDYRGKYVLMFFGYTNCPDECPATMAFLGQVMSQLGNQADRVQVLFISTDPARDTPQAVGDFVTRFNPGFIGLTGTQAVLQAVWQDYGVTVEDNGETHSSFVYLIDPQGNVRLTYPYPITPQDVTADLRMLFKRQ